jgi:hypothetical protein
MDLSLLDSRQPSNATYHNLTGKKLPCGSDQLLGLSLKFCIQEKIPKPQVAKTVARLRRAIRLTTWLDSRSNEETGNRNDGDNILCLYLPSTWTPPLSPTHIKNGLTAFEGKLNDHFEQHITEWSDNLTFFQHRTLKQSQADTSLHICDTDKNLRPAVIGKRVYLKLVYEEQLSASTYFRLNKKECKEFNDETRIGLKFFFPPTWPSIDRAYLHQTSECKS